MLRKKRIASTAIAVVLALVASLFVGASAAQAVLPNDLQSGTYDPYCNGSTPAVDVWGDSYDNGVRTVVVNFYLGSTPGFEIPSGATPIATLTLDASDYAQSTIDLSALAANANYYVIGKVLEDVLVDASGVVPNCGGVEPVVVTPVAPTTSQVCSSGTLNIALTQATGINWFVGGQSANDAVFAAQPANGSTVVVMAVAQTDYVFTGGQQELQWSFVFNCPLPVRTSGPVVSGTTKVGYTVTCSVAYTGATGVGYQWLRNGANIPGATASTYKLSTTDYTKSISCSSGAYNLAGWIAPVQSAKRYVSYGNPIRVTKAPNWSGTAKVGSVVKVSSYGTWSPSPSTITCRWLRNGVSIYAATRCGGYRLTAADKGKYISVRLSAKRYGYADGSTVTRRAKVY